MSSPNPTLVYYGNENLQKGIFNVSPTTARSTSPQEIQLIEKARAIGANVVYTRYGSKEIQVAGHLKVGASIAEQTIEELIARYDSIFEQEEQQDNHWLRIVPEYLALIPTSATTGWTASEDAENLSAATDDFQNFSSNPCLGFDIDVSNTANDYAILTYTSATNYDLSSKTDTGGFEFVLKIPDAYYITGIEYRIGNDASNYYAYNFTQDYQGNNIHNGWNLFNVGWSTASYPRPTNRVGENGTVNDAQIHYFYIKISYDASAIDITGLRLDNIFWTNETRIRNYPCQRNGAIQKSGQHYEIDFVAQWIASFTNYTGYARSTHLWDHTASTEVTGTSDTQIITLEGSLNPFPIFYITANVASTIGSFYIKNLNNNQEVSIDPTSLADNDEIVFGGDPVASTLNGSPLDFNETIPSFTLGKNRLRLSMSGDESVVEYTTGADIGADKKVYALYSAGPSWAGRQDAQKFTANDDGFITKVVLPINIISFDTAQLTLDICATTVGSPGAPSTVLGRKILTPTTLGLQDFTFDFSGVAAVNGTAYWLMLYQYIASINDDARWEANIATGSLALARTYTISGFPPVTSYGAWGTLTNTTFRFEVTITEVPAWTVHWQIKSHKLYQA